jgi:CRISPR-associated endonuclease/helicase Cas3
MDRIIYVIPYLSVTEQVADDIRKALGEYGYCVCEHHSEFLPDEPIFYKLHTDRWDASIIITTQVQFLESVFSARAGKLRKLHNMANAVIIFDEAQSLPIKCVHLFNGALNFLSRVCGSTILLCTATQPALDKVERPVRLTDKDELSIVNCGEMFGNLKRIEVINALKPEGYTPEKLAGFVLDKSNVSTLVVMNTKSSTIAFYKALLDCGMPLIYLSTNLCSAHRSDVIADLRQRLEDKTPVICISTQLIEAGVNISFECVVRGVAGLDSVYQAAGRCNRHGEYGVQKPVYVVNVAGENLSRLPDIKTGAEVTRRLFDEGDVSIETFYRYYFYGRRSEMDYNRPNSAGGTLYDLLSDNRQGCEAYKNRGKTQTVELRQALRTASDEFCVIERGQTEVIVPYGNASRLVSEYRSEQELDDKRRILRELGKYSVSLFKFQLEELDKYGALDYNTVDGLIILNNDFYDEHFGVNLDGNNIFLEA